MKSPVPMVVALCCVTLAGAAARTQKPAADEASWSPRAAAAYLDGRVEWWMTWKNAARDHDTVCVSCHTTLPYALARASLRGPLAEAGATQPERRLFENVAKRVTLWQQVAPFYADQTSGLPKTSESRGTEAILNAVILASRDAAAGQLSPETRTAFENLWALQMRTGPLSGGWAWLNFKYEPWESNDAPYFGASLAAIAVGAAPERYASRPEIADNVTRLRTYLQREFEKQPLFNRVMALWASSRLDGALTAEQQIAVVDATRRAQRADGGWSTSSLGSYKRLDGSELQSDSDGFATGLVTLALVQATAADRNAVARGLEWLRRHQNPATGQWTAASVNKQRDPASDAGRFMSDAATAYAVLALTSAKESSSR